LSVMELTESWLVEYPFLRYSISSLRFSII
jgi:hypothetical protein